MGSLRRDFIAVVVAALAITAVLLVRSPVNGRAVTPAATQTRGTSCSGYDFHPADSDTWYDYVGTLVYHHVTNDPASQKGSGFFICNPNLPQSAVVTRVQFTVYDNFNGDQVTGCALVRNPLGSTASGYDVMAQVPGTGNLKTPGRVRLTDSTIAAATVNNLKYAYWLQCQVTAEDNTDEFTGIYGANVVYTIDPAKG